MFLLYKILHSRIVRLILGLLWAKNSKYQDSESVRFLKYGHWAPYKANRPNLFISGRFSKIWLFPKFGQFEVIVLQVIFDYGYNTCLPKNL